MKKFIAFILCVIIICVAGVLGFKYMYPEKYNEVADKIGEKIGGEQKSPEDYSKSFLLSWGMTEEEVQKIIVDEWGGFCHEDQVYENGETVSRAYSVTQLGDIGECDVKMFLEFDTEEGLCFIKLYYNEGNNADVISLTENGLEVTFSETKDALGDAQYSVLTTEGTAAVYNDENQIVFYNVYSDNSTTRENNYTYNIL